jgi:hypothetical protein
VRLLDMARDLIRLSGFVPDEDIFIEFTGLRPGEKLFEELVGVGEDVGPSSVEKILRVKNRAKPDARLAPFVERLERHAQHGATDNVLAAMHALIPEYGASPDAPLEQLAPEHEIRSGATPETHHTGEQACPHCPGGLHRSHARSLPERMRKGLSHRRLFRCDDCGWRGWLMPLQFGDHDRFEVPSEPDLASLDAVALPPPKPPRPSFAPRNLN